MIQSGNWSENSIPFNEGDGVVVGAFEPGNRDMGLAVHSQELAGFLCRPRRPRYAPGAGRAAGCAPPAVAAHAEPASPASEIFFEAAPPEVPDSCSPACTVTPSTPVPITPVITPENFHDTVEGVPALRQAQHPHRAAVHPRRPAGGRSAAQRDRRRARGQSRPGHPHHRLAEVPYGRQAGEVPAGDGRLQTWSSTTTTASCRAGTSCTATTS